MALESTDAPVPLGDYVPTADHRVVLYSVEWEGYEALLSMRGEQRRPRMTYLDGAVELMTTSDHHERIRYVFGRLLERYMIALGIRYTAYGETTFKHRRRKAGLEADECYVLGDARTDRPDVALEVVWTSGGIAKLEVYEPLGVPEVWMWKKGAVHVFVLTDEGYEQRDRSALLPDIDLAFLTPFLDRPSSGDTLIEFERALAAKLRR
ncbi:MAG: Uma2 family endonuclease [Deltaproteobacteria bacterium]|nr:Uma2 family endonuclease [Deltaproteobacteria bacterium]